MHNFETNTVFHGFSVIFQDKNFQIWWHSLFWKEIWEAISGFSWSLTPLFVYATSFCINSTQVCLYMVALCCVFEMTYIWDYAWSLVTIIRFICVESNLTFVLLWIFRSCNVLITGRMETICFWSLWRQASISEDWRNHESRERFSLYLCLLLDVHIREFEHRGIRLTFKTM
mgnify:CR=1 FL=1